MQDGMTMDQKPLNPNKQDGNPMEKKNAVPLNFVCWLVLFSYALLMLFHPIFWLFAFLLMFALMGGCLSPFSVLRQSPEQIAFLVLNSIFLLFPMFFQFSEYEVGVWPYLFSLGIALCVPVLVLLGKKWKETPKNKPTIFGFVGASVVFLGLMGSLVSGVLYRNSFVGWVEYQMGVSLPPQSEYEVVWENRSPFLGDGSECLRITFSEEYREAFEQELFRQDELRTMPYDPIFLHFIEMAFLDEFEESGISLHELHSGYYLLVDRQTGENPALGDDSFMNRYSYNLSMLIYDDQTNTVYFLEFDT